jgi:glycosyltransferase involved in cell wall biosynthesis
VRVAYYSPLPPERSGIADYSELLLPALRERIDLVVAKRGRRRPPRGTDLPLYQIGNDPQAHGWIVEALRGWPGVAVLHEYVLHHLVAGLTLARGDVATYLAAMEREAGLAGRLLAHGVVERSVPPLWEQRPEDFPLAGFILDEVRDHGVVVHSRYVRGKVRETGFTGRIWVVPHPAWPVPDVEPARIDGDFVIACLGHVNTSKRVPQLLEAFARLRQRHPGARLVLAGAVAARFDLDSRLARLGLDDGEAVVRHDYVDERTLWSLLARCDVCVGLRSPTMGETSGIALRALSLGKPLVVSDVGWFSELPDAVALRVPVDEHEVETIAAALDLLARDESIRRGMGEAAALHAVREHGVGHVAELYAAALEEAAGGRAVADAVLGEVAAAAAEVGIVPGSPEAAELGARLRETRIGE